MNPFIHAKSIWVPEETSANQTVLFSTSFSVSNPEKCRFFIYAHSNYALYINDIFVDSGSFPGYEDQRFYDTLEIKETVVPGDNRFLLYAYHQGEDSFTERTFAPGVIFCLMEGEEEILLSDAGLPCCIDPRFETEVPKISPQLSFSFAYTMAKKLPPLMPAAAAEVTFSLSPRPVKKLVVDDPVDCQVVAIGNAASFDPSLASFLPAQRMQRAFRRLARPSGEITLPSKEGLSLREDNCVVIDLLKERVGFLALDMELPVEGTVLIGWGEHLEDQHVRTKIGVRNFAATLTLAKGRHPFFYPFKRMGLRYLELHISCPGAILYYAGVRPSYYPLSSLQVFSSSDHLHNQIYRTGIRTLFSCMHEHYEDCPWREQALYTMDSRNQMLAGYYAFEEYTFPRASLDLIAKSLRPDHLLELISPGKSHLTIPSFSAIYLVQAYEYLKYSEDIGFIRRILPVLTEIADGFLTKVDDTGMLPRFPKKAPGDLGEYWNFYEWQDGLDGSHVSEKDTPIYDAPLNAFVILGIQYLASLLFLMGDHKRSTTYLERLLPMKSAFHEMFFDESRGVYASFSQGGVKSHYAQLTQALSLLCDIPPKEVSSAVRYHLAYDDETVLVPATLSHSIFRLEALLQDPEKYASLVFETIAKQYGSMLFRGATTFFETLDGADAFDKAGSLCHGWSAIPVYFYLKYAANIKKEGTRLTEDQTNLHKIQTQSMADPSSVIEKYY